MRRKYIRNDCRTESGIGNGTSVGTGDGITVATVGCIDSGAVATGDSGRVIDIGGPLTRLVSHIYLRCEKRITNVDAKCGTNNLYTHKEDLDDPEGNKNAFVPWAAIAMFDVLGARHSD